MQWCRNTKTQKSNNRKRQKYKSTKTNNVNFSQLCQQRQPTNLPYQIIVCSTIFEVKAQCPVKYTYVLRHKQNFSLLSKWPLKAAMWIVNVAFCISIELCWMSLGPSIWINNGSANFEDISVSFCIEPPQSLLLTREFSSVGCIWKHIFHMTPNAT